MPSEKPRDMDDTWAPEELHKSLKGKDDKRRSSTRDRDKDRERRKDDDRKSRTREGDKKDKDREKRERDKEKDKDREKRNKERNGDEKKPRERDRDRERRRRTEEEKGSSSKSKDESDRRRHREDRDRRDRDDKDRKKDRDDRKKPKEDKEDRKSKDDDGKRRRHREENGERSSKSKENGSDDEKRDRRRRDKDDNKEKRSKNEDETRHHRGRDETEEEREERRRRRREERDRNEEKDGREERRRDRHDRSKDRQRTDRVDSDEGEKKKSSSSKKKAEEPKQGDDGHDDYEDDFEDYEDDFEDDDGDEGSDVGSDKNENEGPANNKPREKDLALDLSELQSDDKSTGYKKSLDWDPQNTSREEMDEILKAMNEENDRLLKESRRPKRKEVDSDEEYDRKQNARPTTASRKNFINFKNAKERQVTSKAVGKAARRGRELLQIVDLDFVAYDMFDMPPVNEYELYMRTYGQSDMKQTYVQTNEDDVEREIQTEEIESNEKWTQYPPEDLRGFGGGDEEPVDPELGSSKPVDSVRLSKFVTKAGSVMCILLEEEKSQKSSSGSMTQRKSNVCVSDGFVELGQHPLLQGRYVSTSWVSPFQTHMLLTVHTENTENNSSVPGKGLLCVWNLNEPSQPNKLLACEGRPQCCCFSPGSSNLAFAGMQDGSLAVWDLREQMSLHKMFKHQDEEYLLRYPTYNTAHVMSNSSHLSAVVSVTPIAAAGDSAMESLDLNSDGDIEGSSSFQIASLEENSKIHLWVAAELSQPDPAGSESDLGLLPGGKIKLLHSSTIVLESPAREVRARTAMQSIDMVLNPKDPSHYYVATDTGCIIHGVRYGGKAPPRAYRGEQDSPLEVTSLDFSPFSEPVFLAGCADGSLRLYSTKTETPIISWHNVTEGRPIKCVCWCKSRPSVFFVLDDSSNLQIWDLNMSDGGALKEEKVSDEQVTSFVLTSDHSATGPGRKPQMVVCLESGAVEVHTVSKEFSAMMPEEISTFSAFIEGVM